jgi:sulfate permease, SulP family
MTLFALTEAVSIGRAIGIRSGQLVDGNQEFIGQGLSNIAGSFFSAYVATGSFNRTSLNYQAGAKTRTSAMIAGFLEIFIVLAIAPLVAYLPTAAMAGILLSLMLYLMRASRPRILVRVPDPKMPNRKFTSKLGTMQECPQLQIMRIDGSLFFGSVAYIREKFARLEQQRPDQKHLTIVAQRISFVDIAGADVLAN